MDWLFQFGEEGGDMGQEYNDFIAGVGAVAMGSTTYEWIVQHTGLLEDPTQWSYSMPTWVFSSRKLPRIEGADIRYVSGDVRPVHAAMVEAAAGKNVWLVGGGELVGQFTDHGLLDEIILGVAPVTLGCWRTAAPAPAHHPAVHTGRSQSRRRNVCDVAVRGRGEGDDLTIGAP